MEVMDVRDPRRLEDVPPNVRHVDALGRGLEEDVDRVPQQAPRARQDQQRDDDRGEDVEPGQAGRDDQHRRDDRGSRPGEIAEDLEVGTAHREAASLGIAQQP